MKENFIDILASAKKEKKITLVTHDGQCHADDVYCTALLKLLFEKYDITVEILRTRNREDLNKIEGEYIVYDVFGGKLDHHGMDEYIEGDEKHKRPLAALGKLWRFAGIQIAETFGIDKGSWRLMDNKFIYYIDVTDNGGSLYDNPATYLFNHFRDSYDSYEESWNVCLQKALTDWKFLLETERKVTELRKVFDGLPIREINGKKFKVSIDHIPPVGDTRDVDGIIWKTDKGLKIRLLNDNKLEDIKLNDQDDLIFQNKDWLAEVKKVENLLELNISK